MRAFSISHISRSLLSFFFTLYASTRPSLRGYTFARCCFSFPRVRFPFFKYYSPSSSFVSLYMPPLFHRLGVIRSRAAVFQLRACFSISHISSSLFFFLSPYMPPLFPRLGVIRSRAAVFHLRACVFHFSDITLTLLLFLPPICLHSSLG